MGGISKQDVLVNGEQSYVLTRSASKDAEEGWSVTERPYRSAPGEDLFRNACTDPPTCLLAGNRVRMADGSTKAIELVRVGDSVMTMSGPKAIEKTEITTLGLTRRVIELRGLGDQALFLSNDHPLWVSRADKSGARREWWGTYNIHHVLFEMHNMTGFELRELPFILNFDVPEQVAHEAGWVHVRPIFYDMDRATKLHHLVVEDGFSFIAEGFPVFSHCRDQQGPATPWTGLDQGASVTKALEQLVTSLA
jgi:hypothetical protein